MANTTDNAPGVDIGTADHQPVAPAVTGPASFADPGPLGLGAFAMTTFVLSCVNAGILKLGVGSIVLSLALFYGGGAQLLAGMWEFRKNNTFGALAFTSYGAFWLSYWGLSKFFVPEQGTSAGDAGNAVGVFLIAWFIFTAYMTVAALRVSGAVTSVFVLLTITYLVLAIGEFATSTGVTKVGGVIGILTALAAWYTSFAGVTNTTWRRTVLPTWPAQQ
ncbi:MAG TPA: acetate uptake transporter [Mycobacteriales bacterium]|nr:acetate uptake transporter [Mycobacteriales bacterium]